MPMETLYILLVLCFCALAVKEIDRRREGQD